jgi:hypothetical protein
MFQKKIIRGVGKDTHVRSTQSDAFKTQNTKSFQMLVGEVSMVEPEPLFKQNYVNVNFARNGGATSCAYPGAFIDPLTGNLHGTYEGPIPGQMVMVGFENGNSHSPFVVQRYPYMGNDNVFTEPKYVTPLTKKLRDSTDVSIGHFSGSYLTFNTGILSGKLPGSVDLYSMTGFTSECALGTSFKQDLLFEMKNASGSVGALLKEFATIMSGATTFGSATSHAFSPDVVLDITAWIAKLLLVIKE